MTLSKENFKLFKEKCDYWLGKLGLSSWLVTYRFEKLNYGLGECATSYKQRAATITLTTEYDFKNIELDLNSQIERCALHEVLEVLLSPLNDIAGDRTFDEIELEREKHTVIRTVENLLLNKEKRKK